MKIAVFGSKVQNVGQIEKLFDILIKHSADIYIQEQFYNYLKQELKVDYSVTGIIKDKNFDADIAISIGGDGTFLRTASCIDKKNIPILGINTGRLGFLADIQEKEIESTFEDIFSGNYRIEERSQLEITIDKKKPESYNYALNEIAVLKQDTASMVTVHAYINDEFLTSYEADGLIVATPTGSTAYSLSTGGPIMNPTAANFILTAVAPHSLTARPLVVDDNCIITLDIESRNESFLISMDGRSSILNTGTRLTIKKADFKLKVIKRIGHTFYGTLRDKLMWGADPRKVQ